MSSEHSLFGLLYDWKNHSVKLVKSPDNIPPRYMETLSLLPDGRVLIVGGALSAAEPYSWMNFPETRVLTYNPTSNKLDVVGNTLHARYGHHTIALNDHEFVLLGGFGLSDKESKEAQAAAKGDRHALFSKPGLTRDVEVFDLKTGKSKVVGQILQPRHSFSAVTMSNGTIFIIGGSNESLPGRSTCASEVYDLKKQKSDTCAIKAGIGSKSIAAGNKIIVVDGANASIYSAGDLAKDVAAMTEPLSKATKEKSLVKDGSGKVFVLGGKFPDDPVEYAHWQKDGSKIEVFKIK